MNQHNNIASVFHLTVEDKNCISIYFDLKGEVPETKQLKQIAKEVCPSIEHWKILTPMADEKGDLYENDFIMIEERNSSDKKTRCWNMEEYNYIVKIRRQNAVGIGLVYRNSELVEKITKYAKDKKMSLFPKIDREIRVS